MKKIELARGGYTLVDDEDYEYLNQFSWHSTSKGYVMGGGKIDGEQVRLSMHRLIMNTPKGMQTDHINHDKLDNRKGNLRICTNSQNNMNKKPRIDYTSKFKGVHWCKKAKKYKVQLKAEGVNLYFGSYDIEEDAAKAYNKAALKHFGEFAYLNKLAENNLDGGE